MPSQDIWQQYRQIVAGPIQATQRGSDKDLDMEIEVGFSKDNDTLSFEVGIWNLSKSTWSQVSKDDPCEVRVGWADTGPTPRSVCIGRIEEKYTDTQRQDRKCVLKGQDQSDQRLNIRFSHTWQNQTPDAIARFIAGEVGLGIGKFDSVGSIIEGYWAAKKDKPARHWLNQLKKEAEKRTGEKWKFNAQEGKLNFMRQSSAREQAVRINQYNATKVDKATGRTDQSSDSEEVEFEAYLDPRLTKDGLVHIDSTDVSGVYRVSSYDFTSSTDNGDHLMSGTAVETAADYTVTFPGSQRGYERAYRQTP